jgi:hypothetical protein
MALFSPGDRQRFLDFLEAIRIEPNGRQAGGRKRLIPGRRWRYDLVIDPRLPILLILSARWRSASVGGSGRGVFLS